MAHQIHEPEPAPHESVPFVPHHILKEAATVPLLVAFMLMLILFYPEHHVVPADPYSTPAHIKPEWYFLAAYQTLKIVPNEILGMTVQGVAVLGLVLLPFLDRAPRKPLRQRPIFTAGFILVILVTVALSVWGKYS